MSLDATDCDAYGPADSTSRSRLLLLEDDVPLRQMLSLNLSDLGYAVCPVGTCREARAVAATQAFDLALLDIGLPDGDGAELASELIEGCPTMGIVLCSGGPFTLTAGRLHPEIRALVSKPVSIHLLDVLLRDPEWPRRRREMGCSYPGLDPTVSVGEASSSGSLPSSRSDNPSVVLSIPSRILY